VADHRLAAVVPVLDEAGAIAGVVRGLRAAGTCCVYVVDGGSTDGTRAVAAAAGAAVLAQRARGYGNACATGLAAAAGHELIAVLDGDGSCDPADLGPMLAAGDRADLVLGRRVAVERGAMPWHARAGNRLVAEALRLRTGRRVHDLSPLKLIRGAALPALSVDEPGYGWTVELVGRALASPWLRVAEVPVSFRRRAAGSSKVSGRPLASVRAGAAMLRRAVAATRRRGLLVLAAKAPRAGHSKTRLAAGIGEEAALRFWRACLRDAGSRLRREAALAGADAVAIVPPGDAAAVRALTGLPCTVQAGHGLGSALAEAVEAAAGLRRPFVAVIGADVPAPPAGAVAEAVKLLRARRPVIGPVEDGGYYLLGLPLPWGARLAGPLFRDHPLGGADVLARTRALLPGAAELAPGADVDEEPDLRRLASRLAADPALAPALSALLAPDAAPVR
jgi:glycosyltransferase A (GT-A) superfamily protein (DUF2064 family)